MSSTNFYRKSKRNWACARLAIQSALEYRLNFFTDAVIQPTLVGVMEVVIWSAIITSTGQSMLNGFPRASYIAYALWAAFFSRIGANWMYEFRMVSEIESGTVNSILTRPITFFEYYLSQFLGYKVLTTATSFLIPIAIVMLIPGPTRIERLPAALALQFFYVIFVYTISFSICSIGFFLNRTYAFTVAKNIGITMLTGELFPLDLVPEPYRHVILSLPFANSTFIPVGYLIGRVEADRLWRGLASTVIGTAIMLAVGTSLWQAGRRRYSGTGA